MWFIFLIVFYDKWILWSDLDYKISFKVIYRIVRGGAIIEENFLMKGICIFFRIKFYYE